MFSVPPFAHAKMYVDHSDVSLLLEVGTKIVKIIKGYTRSLLFLLKARIKFRNFTRTLYLFSIFASHLRAIFLVLSCILLS